VDLNLSMKEFRLLAVMTAHPGRVHSRQDLVNLAWEHDARPTLRTVDKHIQTLRKKLGDSEEHPVIQTLEREGYRWLLPVH
jgi:DNA-binding response OmpR family regulator